MFELKADESRVPELTKFENNDLLLSELHEKERGIRVVLYGLQLDEMWTFVGSKKARQWVWLALNPANRQIVVLHVGGRCGADAVLFYEQIPPGFKGQAGFFSDYWPAYVNAFANEVHTSKRAKKVA